MHRTSAPCAWRRCWYSKRSRACKGDCRDGHRWIGTAH
jgi:hypothetical protein